MKSSAIILMIILLSNIVFAQINTYNTLGTLHKYESEFTQFPHHNRNEGYSYRGNYYSAEDHYNDSTILLFIPNYLKNGDSIDYVFYFHGWWNNIDSSITKFTLIEQFYNSGINGILVLPEVAKNAPDSFGGKLEQENVFNNLVHDITDCLIHELDRNYNLNNIILAGHSGAYHVISYILYQGGITNKISEVYLFDGLYSEEEKYLLWINNFNGRFINIYTPNGGTKIRSENLIERLEESNINYTLIEGDNFTTYNLSNSNIIFIKSYTTDAATIKVHGLSIRDNDQYAVVTSLFLAEGRDGYSFFSQASHQRARFIGKEKLEASRSPEARWINLGDHLIQYSQSKSLEMESLDADLKKDKQAGILLSEYNL